MVRERRHRLAIKPTNDKEHTMKKHSRGIVALALIAGAYLTGTFNTRAADEESRGAAEGRGSAE